MCFKQRTANLSQDRDHAAFRLRSIIVHERLQIDAVQVLHGIIEISFRSTTIVVNGNRIGMIQLAGDLHLTFESGDTFIVDLVDIQHFDCRLAPQHRMMPLVDDAHSARSKFAFQRVLAELLSLNFRLLRLAS